MPFLLDFIFKKQQHIFPNEGVPANPRRDHEWITKRETKLSFCMRMFSMMPSFFHHHQIDLAQRDGHNMLLDQILEDCFLLILGVDYAQNYGHISQVFYFPHNYNTGIFKIRVGFPNQRKGGEREREKEICFCTHTT